MKKHLLGLALAAAGLVGLTAQAATAADDATSQDFDVVVNVIDSTPPEELEPDSDKSGQDANPSSAGDASTGTGEGGSATTGALPYTGFDPRLGVLGLGAMAAGGLLLWGVKRKNNGKRSLPKTALIVAGAAGLVAAGSFTSWAIDQNNTVDTDGDLLITIDKAETLTGQAVFEADLPGASTFFGLQGRINAPEGVQFTVGGQPVTGDLGQVMLVENPEATGHVEGTLVAMIGPDTPVDSFHLVYTVEAVDQRHELTLTPQVEDKTYDGATATDTVVFASTAEFVDGIQDGDQVTVEAGDSLEGVFADANAGSGIGVTVDPSQFSLTGADAHKYFFTVIQPEGRITPKPVTATTEVFGKTYDGNNRADRGGLVLDGIVGEDEVAVSDGVACVYVGTEDLDGEDAGEHATECVLSGDDEGGVLVGAQAGNYELVGIDSNMAVIDPAELTVTGLQADDRVYDGGTDATVLGDGGLVGVIEPDEVGLVGHAVGQFDDKNAGENKPVTVSGLELDGPDAHNYFLTLPQSGADVSKKPVTVDALRANSKTYDGGTTASLDGDAALVGAVPQDHVDLVGTPEGTFGDKQAATGKTVTVTGLSLEGDDAGNYELEQLTLRADITKKPVTVTGVQVSNRAYDGTREASMFGLPGLDGVVTNDKVTVEGYAVGTFDTKDAGEDKTVTVTGLSLEGDDAGNYALQTLTFQRTIWQKSLGIDGYTPVSKTYDGTRVASLQGSPSLTGVVKGETVGLTGSPVATFDDKNVGSNKWVTYTGLSLTGDQAKNYRLDDSYTLFTGQITKRSVSVSGLSAENKTYDGTTSATLVTANAEINGLFDQDRGQVSIAASAQAAQFRDANAGDGKSVDVSSISLQGAASGNYRLVSNSAVLTGDIKPREVKVEVTRTKVYDGSIWLRSTDNQQVKVASGLIGNDTLQVDCIAGGWGSSPNVGSYTWSGPSDIDLRVVGGSENATNNYVLASTFLHTEVITRKPLSVVGAAVNGRVYDGTDEATNLITNRGTLEDGGVVGSDDVTLVTSGVTARFVNWYAGNDRQVALTGYKLEGTAAGNYQLADTATTTASIAKRDWTINVAYTLTKTYDGNTSVDGAELVQTSHSTSGLAPADEGRMWGYLELKYIFPFPSPEVGTYQGGVEHCTVWGTYRPDGSFIYDSYNWPTFYFALTMIINPAPVQSLAAITPMGLTLAPADVPVVDDVVPAGDPSDPQEDVKPLADGASLPDEAAREEDVEPDVLPVGGDEGEPDPEPEGDAVPEGEGSADPAPAATEPAPESVDPEPTETGVAVDAVAEAAPSPTALEAELTAES
ncbi:MAG: YDG domain-containing protein [Bifidobacteriaceae bacterium]|nr:YDG domain-containing protein [Bifidobacteriaceae bacterium]